MYKPAPLCPDGGALDPTRWERMRIQSTTALREAAAAALHAHGTHLVAIPFNPHRPGVAVVVGEPAALSSLLPTSGALSRATQRQMMQTMTRLGLATTYNPEQFDAGFDGEVQRLLRAVESLLDRKHPRGGAR